MGKRSEEKIKKSIISAIEHEGFHYRSMESLHNPRQLRLFFCKNYNDYEYAFSIVIEPKEEK